MIRLQVAFLFPQVLMVLATVELGKFTPGFVDDGIWADSKLYTIEKVFSITQCAASVMAFSEVNAFHFDSVNNVCEAGKISFAFTPSYDGTTEIMVDINVPRKQKRCTSEDPCQAHQGVCTSDTQCRFGLTCNPTTYHCDLVCENKFKSVVDSTPQYETTPLYASGNVIDQSIPGDASPSFVSEQVVNPWIQLELECEMEITGFIVVNRHCSGTCPEKLRDVGFYVSPNPISGSGGPPSTNDDLCAILEGPSKSFQLDVVTCNAPIRGSYVLIQLLYTSPTSLMLNEVIPLTNVVDGSSIEQNAVITSSGAFGSSGYEGFLVVDKRVNTIFASDGINLPSWIQFDFGDQATIKRVVMIARIGGSWNRLGDVEFWSTDIPAVPAQLVDGILVGRYPKIPDKSGQPVVVHLTNPHAGKYFVLAKDPTPTDIGLNVAEVVLEGYF